MLALTTIMIGLPVMFIAAIPWLKQQPESVVYLCAGIAATGTVVASFVLAIQKIVAVSGSLGDVAAPDRKLVLMAFTGGFMSVVLAQMVCTLLLSAGWRYWMSRSE